MRSSLFAVHALLGLLSLPIGLSPMRPAGRECYTGLQSARGFSRRIMGDLVTVTPGTYWWHGAVMGCGTRNLWQLGHL